MSKNGNINVNIIKHMQRRRDVVKLDTIKFGQVFTRPGDDHSHLLAGNYPTGAGQFAVMDLSPDNQVWGGRQRLHCMSPNTYVYPGPILNIITE